MDFVINHAIANHDVEAYEEQYWLTVSPKSVRVKRRNPGRSNSIHGGLCEEKPHSKNGISEHKSWDSKTYVNA